MLSLQTCRELLGHDSNITDGQIEQLRSQMYALASVGISAHRRMTAGPAGPFKSALSALAPSALAEAEERAAIADFDGGLSRDQAERLALDRVLKRVR